MDVLEGKIYIPDEDKVGVSLADMVKTTRERGLSEYEKNNIADMARAMAQTPDQLEVFLDNIPVEACLERIKKEVARLQDFERAVKGVMGQF